MFSYELLENEKVVLLGRQSESILLGPAFGILLSVYIPIALLLRSQLLGNFVWVLLSWTLLVLLYGLHKYFTWLMSVHIVTNKRVVNLSYKSIFSHEESEMLLSDIRNVKIYKSGVMGSLFSFSDLRFESGVAGGGVLFPKVRHSAEIRQEVWKLRERLNQIPISHRSPQKFELSVRPAKRKVG